MSIIKRRPSKEMETAFRTIAEDVWSEGEVDLIDDLFAENFVGHGTALPADLHGPAAYRAYVEEYREAFPDMRVHLHDVLVGDGEVAARYRVSGTHEGRLKDVAPTGRKIEIDGAAFARFEDGRCVEEWNFADTESMMRQLDVDVAA